GVDVPDGSGGRLVLEGDLIAAVRVQLVAAERRERARGREVDAAHGARAAGLVVLEDVVGGQRLGGGVAVALVDDDAGVAVAVDRAVLDGDPDVAAGRVVTVEPDASAGGRA